MARAAGALAAAAIAVVGVVGVQARPGQSRRSSFAPVSASASASRSSVRSGLIDRLVARFGGEFDVSRAFSSAMRRSPIPSLEYKPAAVVDSGGKFQSIGISLPPGPRTSAGFDSYDFSECTWWAAVRRSQLGKPVPAHLGNGGQWADSARAKGLSVDSTPKVGDVVVFAPGQAGAVAYYGHVAVVEAILSDGSILVSECSENYNGQIKVRRIWDASHYQYIH